MATGDQASWHDFAHRSTRTSKEKNDVRSHSSGQSKAGKAEELARRIKEGAIPIISDVPGFQAYYVIYSPEVGRTEPGASAYWAGHSGRRTGDCSYFGLVYWASLSARYLLSRCSLDGPLSRNAGAI